MARSDYTAAADFADAAAAAVADAKRELDISRLERLLWSFAVAVNCHGVPELPDQPHAPHVRPRARPDGEMTPDAARLWDITGALALEIVNLARGEGPR